MAATLLGSTLAVVSSTNNYGNVFTLMTHYVYLLSCRSFFEFGCLRGEQSERGYRYLKPVDGHIVPGCMSVVV